MIVNKIQMSCSSTQNKLLINKEGGDDNTSVNVITSKIHNVVSCVFSTYHNWSCVQWVEWLFWTTTQALVELPIFINPIRTMCQIESSKHLI